jgi:formylglycine-generating enzyme required for sulfatase activity
VRLVKPTKLHPTCIALIVAGAGAFWPAPADAARVRIAEATFTPQYGPGGSKLPVRIASFEIDQTPVTRAKFAEFLGKNAAWKKTKVGRAFADEGYLSGWKSNAPPKGTGEYPVVHVSYFAAAAFCEWAGGRLPTVMEWEYVAAAGKKTAEGTKDPAQVTEWIEAYSSPVGPRKVGQSPANFHGVQDLHGMVWEWTQDYNSSFITADNREDGEMSSNLFCGVGAMGAADRANYPAFMRYAMRGGLRPNYTIANQGFRCAYDLRSR